MSTVPVDRRKTPYERRNLRAEAEAELANNPGQSDIMPLAATAPVELLLHELQVRQIELEMQNEELRRAHIALEESRDRYLDLFEFAPVGYLTLTSHGLITEANLSTATLLGVERKKLLQNPFSRYISAENVDLYHLYLSKISADDAPQSFDIEIKLADGTMRHVHMNAVPVNTESGELILRVTLTDISKIKHAEIKTLALQHQLQATLNAIPDPLFEMGLDGMYYDCHSMQSNASVAPREGLVGHLVTEVLPHDAAEVVMSALAEAHGTGSSRDKQYALQLDQGQRCFELSVARKSTIAEESPRFIVISRDVTERKQIEESLRIAASAFETQEGIMVTDDQRIIMRVNQAFTQLTGYSAEESIGQPVSMLKSGRHDDVFYAAMTAALDSKSYWHGDIWDKRKNGEIFPARMLISTVKDTAGKTSHYVGSFLDITEQKQAEKVLSDDRKRLEKQVEKSVTELGQIKEESSEVNTALKVMIKLRETENSDAKNLLILELKQEVMPFLQRLKNSSRDPKHIRLLNILDANLQRLISSYGSATSLTSAYKNLTPKEIQVASMVREGASTKVIASTLSLSPETISIHRKNIRKKLSLGSKADNLRSYLLTFDK
jgi:PAS domain S-box-containing protein